jgi:hypothetical protein
MVYSRTGTWKEGRSTLKRNRTYFPCPNLMRGWTQISQSKSHAREETYLAAGGGGRSVAAKAAHPTELVAPAPAAGAAPSHDAAAGRACGWNPPHTTQ